MSSPRPRASVLICTRERPGLLAETIASLLAGDQLPDELVVVDQSAAPSGEPARLGAERGCPVRYLHVPGERGLSRARNLALASAAHDVAVMLDDDMLVEPAWLGRLLAGLGSAPRAIATGRVLAAPPEPGRAGSVPAAALVERAEAAVYRGRQPLDVVPGANVALPRRVVLELGGYDERLGAGTRFAAADDNDIGLRLLEAGCEVRHVPGAVVYHRAWRTPRELVRMRWDYGRGKGAFYAKHATLRDRWILRRAAADLGRRLARAARALPRRPRAAAGELVTLAGTVAGALDWLVTVRLAAALRRR